MKLMKSLKSIAAVALLFSAGVASAATYQFNLTGDYTASWQLNSTVSPDAAGEGEGFILWDVEGNVPGSLFDIADLTFYNADIGGGMEIYDFYGDTYLLVTDGTQLYTGSEDSPTFRLGTFGMTEFGGTGTYTLTVTDLDAGPGPGPDPDPTDVPEPATAAMLLSGLGMLYASRKRRQGK
jgi:hypothetical protein